MKNNTYFFDYSRLFKDDDSLKIKWYCYPIVWFLFVVSFFTYIKWKIRFKIDDLIHRKDKDE